MTKLTAEEFAALEPILWKRTTSDHLLLRAMEEVVRLRSLRSKDGTEAEREMLADEFEKLPVHLWGRCTGCVTRWSTAGRGRWNWRNTATRPWPTPLPPG